MLESSVSLRCSKVGLDCILSVLPALTQPLPSLHHLVQTGVLGVPVRTSLMRKGPLRERKGTITASQSGKTSIGGAASSASKAQTAASTVDMKSNTAPFFSKDVIERTRLAMFGKNIL